MATSATRREYARRGVSASRGSRVLALVVALMVAATSRFRIQIFVPLLPGFVLIAASAWWYGGERVFLAAAATAATGGALLLLETRSAVHLPGTGEVRLGYNAVGSIAWVKSTHFWR